MKQPKVDIFQTDSDIRRALEETHNQEWALCGQNFWYWVENYIRTEDEERKTIRPFPGNIPYLHSLDEAVSKYHKVIVLKPRRMKVSWYGMLKQFHGAFFAGTGIPDVPQMFYGGTGSIGETEALYLMERISKPYRLLPEWMKARNPIVRDNELIKEFAAGGKIQGFPLKRQGPQTFGFSFFFFDEMAWQEAVRGTWKGLIPTLGGEGTLLAVSTPNGKFNLFSDVWHNKDNAYDDIYRWECDWWDDPEHDEKWFRNATTGLKKNEIAQMFLKSFAIPSGDPIWSEYDDDVHSVDDVQPFEGKPLFIGVDCGYHFPAISLWQRSSRDQWAGLFEYQGYSISFDDFLVEFVVKANTVLDLKKYDLIFCLPPDALQAYRTKARSGAQNDLQEVKKMFPNAQIRIGPHEVGTRTNEGPRLKEVRKLWKLRADGEPGMYFSRKMKMFREGCQGGYHYPETKNAASSEQPDDSEHCVPLDVPALTPQGWKRHDELKLGDEIYSFDIERGETVKDVLCGITLYEGPKEVIRLFNAETEFISTPNHHHVIENKQGKLSLVQTKDLKSGHHLIHPYGESRKGKDHLFTPFFISLAGWIAAEGWYEKNGPAVLLAESNLVNPEYVKYLDSLLGGLSFVTRRQGGRSGMVTWRISGEYAYLIRHWMPNKCPSWAFIAAMTNEDRRRFIFEFSRGDGYFHNGNGPVKVSLPKSFGRNRDILPCLKTLRISQKRFDVCEAIQAIGALAGLPVTIREKVGYNQSQITIHKMRSKAGIHWMHKESIYADGVWCPTTTRGTWICKQGLRVWATGNTHLQDSFQNVVTCFNRMFQFSSTPKPPQKRDRIGHRTGM